MRIGLNVYETTPVIPTRIKSLTVEELFENKNIR